MYFFVEISDYHALFGEKTKLFGLVLPLHLFQLVVDIDFAGGKLFFLDDPAELGDLKAG